AFVKASESTTYTNPFFADDYAGIQAAGLVRGAYHFARPAYPVASTANAQASYFAKLIGDVNATATLPPVLDLEVTGGLPRADLVTWAQIFLYKLRALTGRTPMLYTYPSFWTDVLADPSAFSRFPIWMASYGAAPTVAAELWQYTDSASISGISGHVDESKFLGNGGIPWTTLSDGTVPTSWPTAAPKAPHSLAVTPGPTTATVSWVPGNDGSARTTSYVVTSNPGNITQTVNGASTSATVTGLDPATSYTFTVQAVSSAGTSAPSATTPAVTPVVATQLSLTEPASIKYGTLLTISGVLKRTDTSAGVGGQTVTIYRRATGKTARVERGTTTTASDGSLLVKMHPTRSIDIKLDFAGSPGYEPDSATGSTVVHWVVAAALSKTTARHNHYVKITGTLTPAVEGAQVIRQQRVGTTWQNGPAKPVDKNGAFSFRLHPTHKKTTLTYRIFVASANGLAAGASPVLILTVK
ncbi:MAG: GH25 family lysozyme, partial [Mycobacteriales bacterium]